MDGLQACICQVVIGPFVNVSLFLDLVVIRQTVYFMNEHLKVDVCVDFVGSGHGEMQPAHSFHVVVLPEARDKRVTQLKGRFILQLSLRCYRGETLAAALTQILLKRYVLMVHYGLSDHLGDCGNRY